MSDLNIIMQYSTHVSTRLRKDKKFKAEIFSDGINANKVAVDYKREITEVDSTTKRTYRLASGGGLAMIIK